MPSTSSKPSKKTGQFVSTLLEQTQLLCARNKMKIGCWMAAGMLADAAASSSASGECGRKVALLRRNTGPTVMMMMVEVDVSVRVCSLVQRCGFVPTILSFDCLKKSPRIKMWCGDACRALDEYLPNCCFVLFFSVLAMNSFVNGS